MLNIDVVIKLKYLLIDVDKPMCKWKLKKDFYKDKVFFDLSNYSEGQKITIIQISWFYAN